VSHSREQIAPPPLQLPIPGMRRHQRSPRSQCSDSSLLFLYSRGSIRVLGRRNAGFNWRLARGAEVDGRLSGRYGNQQLCGHGECETAHDPANATFEEAASQPIGGAGLLARNNL
jgi:hypothetical protein